jgi:hypothetical protein
MRAGIASALLLLSACGSGAGGPWRQEGNESGEAVAGLECATDGASDYGAGCTIVRTSGHTGTVFTLRSPTGSFRRLRVTNGRIEAADGAEPARILGGDSARVELAIGGDRYRIPRVALR